MDNKENLNNLPPFYVGQKVVYITGINMPKNSIHRVRVVEKCVCGCWRIDIGIKPKIEFIEAGEPSLCFDCGYEGVHKVKHKRLWKASSFRPLQEQSFPLIKYTRVLKDVPVGAN